MTRITGTDFDVAPICLGGNVFGWTADRDASFAVLDAFAEAGGSFIDTADVYSAWLDGHSGGESETIIGEWMTARGNRSEMVIATKVGMLEGAMGLSRDSVRSGAEASLRRLQTDYIDLYYTHKDDRDTPLTETAAVLGELVAEGKARYLGASNYSADRLREALEVTEFAALQTLYNLSDRAAYEDELQAVAVEAGLSVVPYYSLASGFLTGKYRGTDTDPSTGRSPKALTYLDDRGHRILGALDEVAGRYETTQATVALTWLRSRPGIDAPLASARTPEQVAALMASVALDLDDEAIGLLDAASA